MAGTTRRNSFCCRGQDAASTFLASLFDIGPAGAAPDAIEIYRGSARHRRTIVTEPQILPQAARPRRAYCALGADDKFALGIALDEPLAVEPAPDMIDHVDPVLARVRQHRIIAIINADIGGAAIELGIGDEAEG